MNYKQIINCRLYYYILLYISIWYRSGVNQLVNLRQVTIIFHCEQFVDRTISNITDLIVA